jgi:hypothetical protein
MEAKEKTGSTKLFSQKNNCTFVIQERGMGENDTSDYT